MKQLNTLYVRWPDHNDPTQIIIYDPVAEKIIQDSLEGKYVVAYLPATQTQIMTVSVPGKSKKQKQALLPALLEEQMAQDIDELYFVLDGQNEGKDVISYINKEVFNNYYQALRATGAHFDTFIPEILVCPYYQIDTWTLMITDTYSWLRSSLVDGFAIETTSLLIYLQTMQSTPTQCNIYHSIPLDPALLQFFQDHGIGLMMHTIDQDILLQWDHNLGTAFAFPFCGREFPAQMPKDPLRKYIITAACLFGLTVILWGIQQYLSVQQLKLEKDHLDNEVLALYQQVFPDQTKVMSPRTTFSSELKKYPKVSNQPSLTQWLQLLGEAILPDKVHIEQLDYENHVVTLIISGDPAELKSYQNNLKAKNIQIEIISSLDNLKDNLKNRLHLKLTLMQ